MLIYWWCFFENVFRLVIYRQVWIGGGKDPATVLSFWLQVSTMIWIHPDNYYNMIFPSQDTIPAYSNWMIYFHLFPARLFFWCLFFNQEPVLATAPTNDPIGTSFHCWIRWDALNHMDATKKCEVLIVSFMVNLGQWLVERLINRNESIFRGMKEI